MLLSSWISLSKMSKITKMISNHILCPLDMLDNHLSLLFFSHGSSIDVRRSLSYFMNMTTATKNFHLDMCQACKYFGWSKLLNSICNLTRWNFYGNLRSLFQQNWRLKIHWQLNIIPVKCTLGVHEEFYSHIFIITFVLSCGIINFFW